MGGALAIRRLGLMRETLHGPDQAHVSKGMVSRKNTADSGVLYFAETPGSSVPHASALDAD